MGASSKVWGVREWCFTNKPLALPGRKRPGWRASPIVLRVRQAKLGDYCRFESGLGKV